MKPERRQSLKAPTVLCLALLAGSAQVAHAQDLRAQEIAQCLPGEISTWGDGTDHPVPERRLVFVYSHQLAPAWFSHAEVIAALRAAASGWGACGIPVEVHGTDVAVPSAYKPVEVQWSASASRGNFGLADLGTHSLSLGPQAFEMLQARNPAAAKSTLQMVLSHEMGHFFGIMAHSRRCVDVTSYYHDGKGTSCFIRGGGTLLPGVEYRATLPTACDIARCRQVNFPGLP